MNLILRDIEYGGFDHYLRTGRHAAGRRLEVKFNPYHDPDDGRFTDAAGTGGGGASTSSDQDREIVVTGRRLPLPKTLPIERPFASAAQRHDAVGAIARQVNAFANGRAHHVALPLGEGKDLILDRGRGGRGLHHP